VAGVMPAAHLSRASIEARLRSMLPNGDQADLFVDQREPAGSRHSGR